MHAWLVPRQRDLLSALLMSARHSWEPDICKAEPSPVTHLHAKSC